MFIPADAVAGAQAGAMGLVYVLTMLVGSRASDVDKLRLYMLAATASILLF
jgi:hypothetical protein